MNELIERITAKCLDIYCRKKSLKAVYRYLERLLPDDIDLRCTIEEEHAKPLIRSIYYNLNSAISLKN